MAGNNNNKSSGKGKNHAKVTKRKRSANNNIGSRNESDPTASPPSQQQQPQWPIVLFFLGSFVAATLAIWYQRHLSSASTITPTTPRTKTTLAQLAEVACHHSTATSSSPISCNDFLWLVEGRTLYTLYAATAANNKNHDVLRPGMKLMEVPRSALVTVVDALRDPRVLSPSQSKARQTPPQHAHTGRPLDPRAYLALHLAWKGRDMKTSLYSSSSSSSSLSKRTTVLQNSPLHDAYLDYLPTYDDFASFHPSLLSTATTSATKIITEPSSSSSSSLASFLNARWANEINSEWEALTKHSFHHGHDAEGLPLDWTEYAAARLNVQTRSFTGHEPSLAEVNHVELRRYAIAILGLDHPKDHQDLHSLRSKLTSCMVPLLDTLDHHVDFNVGWKAQQQSTTTNNQNGSQDQEGTSFVAFVAQDIDVTVDGQRRVELRGTYGEHKPDSWIYAQYGFVNDDGSGRRAALLALHTIHDLVLESQPNFWDSQRLELYQLYLDYHDGYHECLATKDATGDPDEAVVLFQRLKAEVLQSTTANAYSKWVVTIPPTGEIDSGIQNLMNTCRVLALTHRDYDGKATQLLQLMMTTGGGGGSTSSSFRLPQPSNENDSVSVVALEFRAWHWMMRLVRAQFDMDLSDDDDDDDDDDRWMVAATAVIGRWQVQLQELPQHSPDWTRTFVRLGELETALTVGKYAQQRKMELLGNKSLLIDDKEAFVVRSRPCGKRSSNNVKAA